MGDVTTTDDHCAGKGRVLFVTFDFPPRRTSATYRVTNFARFLRDYGWQPTVLTIRRSTNDFEEFGQLEKVPAEVQIERTRYWRVDAWENPVASAAKAVGGLKASPSIDHQSFFDRCLRSLAEFVRSCLYFPDATIGWVPFSVARGIHLHRREPFKVIYTTDPPRSASVIGLILKLALGIPWVLEFMDPWYPPKRRLRRTFERWFQGLMFPRADAIITMTRGHADDLRERFHIAESKFAVVPNGYDEDDFRDACRKPTDMQPAGHLHLSHFGTIYPNNSGAFFEALADLLEERPELKARLRVHLVGFPDVGIRRFATQRGLLDILEFRDFIPVQAQVVREMYAADCLLLFWGDPESSRLAAAGKTYVYLRTGRPILAVTSQGVIREHVEKSNAGWTVDPNDRSGIKNALLTIVAHLQSKGCLPSARQDYVVQFRWDRLAKELDEVLNRATGYGK